MNESANTRREWILKLEESIAGDTPLAQLRDLVADRISEGEDRNQVQEQLETFRTQLHDQSRDDDEDMILDVLDFLTGWCSPGVAREWRFRGLTESPDVSVRADAGGQAEERFVDAVSAFPADA